MKYYLSTISLKIILLQLLIDLKKNIQNFLQEKKSLGIFLNQ